MKLRSGSTFVSATVCVMWRVAAIVMSVEIMMSCVSSAPHSVSVRSRASCCGVESPLATMALCWK